MKPGFALDKRTLLVSVPLCLALCALVNLAGYLLDCRYVSIPAAIAQANDYEVRSRLLMEAMEKVGVCEPEDAALVWASGLDMRSAALQYAVMDAQLKAEYARQLEETSPNWVTGMSSPWIESYSIEKIKRPGRDSRIIRLVFSTASSTGADSYYLATLTIVRNDRFWRISKIEADEGLYPYMGFRPE